jgi:hypothetical protein
VRELRKHTDAFGKGFLYSTWCSQLLGMKGEGGGIRGGGGVGGGGKGGNDGGAMGQSGREMLE